VELRVADMNYKGLCVSHRDREIINGDREDRDKGYFEGDDEREYFLILVVHSLIELGTTDLTQHFGENLRSVAVCCFFVAFFVVFLTFGLKLLGFVRDESEGGRTSIDNTTRCDCSGEECSRRKYMETPPSSIALII
jgi:hypothetical protein